LLTWVAEVARMGRCRYLLTLIRSAGVEAERGCDLRCCA
jgi:hypothetical protein